MQHYHHILTSDLSATMSTSVVSLANENKLDKGKDHKSYHHNQILLPESVINMLTDLFEKNNYSMVMKIASGFLEESPRSIFLLNILGETASILSCQEEAISYFERLIDCEPYSEEINRKKEFLPNVYHNLSILKKDLGYLDEAEMYVKKAIKLNPDFQNAYNTYGTILNDKADIVGAKVNLLKAININPLDHIPYWNLQSTASSLQEACQILECCVEQAPGFEKGVITLAGLKAFMGDRSHFDLLKKSGFYKDPLVRSIDWVLSLPTMPEIHFNRWSVFDRAVEWSDRNRPFYEFGVWMGDSFKYLIHCYDTGYGFDTFSGLPEQWRTVPKGTYSSYGFIPEIIGGNFIAGKFDDTLPIFFEKTRPLASIINFDADLYSSTKTALNYSASVIDDKTILIFDEFIVNPEWEMDEHRALNEFCKAKCINYEVLAVSLFTKQVVCRLSS